MGDHVLRFLRLFRLCTKCTKKFAKVWIFCEYTFPKEIAIIIDDKRPSTMRFFKEEPKMMKAVYKGKVKDKNGYATHLFYEYRGHEYMITDEHNGYSEPMWVKHKNEQDRIDREIEEARKPKKEYRYEDTAEYGFNLFWDYLES